MRRYLLLAAGQPARVHTDAVAEPLPAWDPWRQPDEHVARVVALWIHWRQTGNGWLLAEAFAAIVERGRAPPRWVLEGLAAGLQRAINEPGTPPEVALGLASKGKGRRDPRNELAHRQRLSGAMIAMARLVGVGCSDKVAAAAVRERFPFVGEPETLERAWRDEWRDFMVGATGLPAARFAPGAAATERRRTASHAEVDAALAPYGEHQRAVLRDHLDGVDGAK